MLTPDLIFGFALGSTLSLTIFLIYVLAKQTLKPKDFHFSEADYEILQAEKKASNIVGKASQAAEKIRGRAELTENTLVAELRFEAKKIQEKHLGELETAFRETREAIARRIIETDEKHARYLKALEERLGKIENEAAALAGKLRAGTEKMEADFGSKLEATFLALKEGVETRVNELETANENNLRSLEEQLLANIDKNQSGFEAKTNEFFAEGQKLLEKFITDLQSRTETQVDKEIGAAKKIVERYREQRLEVVDEQIVAILEETLSLTLGKKLTLGEQTALVYEALEQAKKENIFS